MNIDHLVKMANEISLFYVSDAPNDAAKSIASHLTRFWEPRMRKAIIEYNSQGGGGLKESVRAALTLLTTK